MINKLKSKRAQLTLFVIVAVIIIASLVVGLLYFKKSQEIPPEEDLQGYVEKCISDGVKASETKLLENNGYINLSNNYLVYYGEKVPYLCKATQFYIPCINQEPMYIGHLKKELEKDIKVIKIQNTIQTIAVIVFFLFGIGTINDLMKKK